MSKARPDEKASGCRFSNAARQGFLVPPLGEGELLFYQKGKKFAPPGLSDSFKRIQPKGLMEGVEEVRAQCYNYHMSEVRSFLSKQTT